MKRLRIYEFGHFIKYLVLAAHWHGVCSLVSFKGYFSNYEVAPFCARDTTSLFNNFNKKST